VRLSRYNTWCSSISQYPHGLRYILSRCEPSHRFSYPFLSAENKKAWSRALGTQTSNLLALRLPPLIRVSALSPIHTKPKQNTSAHAECQARGDSGALSRCRSAKRTQSTTIDTNQRHSCMCALLFCGPGLISSSAQRTWTFYTSALLSKHPVRVARPISSMNHLFDGQSRDINQPSAAQIRKFSYLFSDAVYTAAARDRFL
jgi:hypothetical protein